LTDREQAARALLTKLQARRELLLRKREKPVKCLLVLGHEVSGEGIKEIFIVGRNGYLNELIELAGGENVFRQKNPHFPKISREGLIQLDPDVIIELVPYPDPDGKDTQRRKSAWSAVDHLRAVEAGEVHVIRGAFLLRAGPRYLDTLDALVKVLDGL
jgi:iron complex transport system substrate-binding protein